MSTKIPAAQTALEYKQQIINSVDIYLKQKQLAFNREKAKQGFFFSVDKPNYDLAKEELEVAKSMKKEIQKIMAMPEYSDYTLGIFDGAKIAHLERDIAKEQTAQIIVPTLSLYPLFQQTQSEEHNLMRSRSRSSSASSVSDISSEDHNYLFANRSLQP